jgi:hypothetical protein
MVSEARKARRAARLEKNLATDSAYQAQINAINLALANFQKGQALDADIRGQDYSAGLRNLGFNAGTGTFDPEDKYQGYGGARNAARQNFASRGMLGSSGYNTAGTNIDRSFADQKNTMERGQQNYASQQKQAATEYETEAKNAQLLAKEAAIQRRRQALTAGLAG